MRSMVLVFLTLTVSAWAAEPLDWNSCVSLAGEMHPDLISAQQDVISARADLTSARSDRLPSVDATAGISKGWGDTDDKRSSNAGLTASQTLFDFGATKGAVRSASASVDSARSALILAQAQVRYDLRVAYLNLWEHQEMLRVLETIKGLRETNLRMIHLRYEGGTEHKGSYLQAKSKYSQASVQLAQEERSAKSLQRKLSQAMGLPDVRDFSVSETPVDLESIPDKTDLEQLADTHPSVLEQKAAVRVAKAELQQAKSTYGPTVSLSASAGFTDDDYSPSDDDESISLSVDWPIFDFGSRSAGVQKARADLRSAQAQLKQTQRQVAVDLEDAYNDYKDALEDDEVAQESLAAATERNKISKAQYEVGLSTYDDWTLIEDSYVSAQKEALQTRLEALVAEAAWIEARGEIYGEN